MPAADSNVTLLNSFDVVAGEYYDPARHPTCSNFRNASDLIIGPWLRQLPEGASICEVGAGKSLVAELLVNNQRRLDQLLLTDESAAMLRYSQSFEATGAKLTVANAERLPLASGSIDCVVSSLGDPYNTSGFWMETSRVLKPGGKVFFTSPAYDWAASFRNNADTANFAEAEFELVDGRRVSLPSLIYPEGQQQKLIESTGLTVCDIQQVTLRHLQSGKLSPKLRLDRGLEAAVVTGYLVQKPPSDNSPR